MAEKLSDAQQQAIRFIKNRSASELGAIGTEIGNILAELTVELADAKEEAKHWKRSFETVRDEMKVAIGLAIRKLGGERLVVTRRELAELAPNTELYVGTPEPGVRIYELRERNVPRGTVKDGVNNHDHERPN